MDCIKLSPILIPGEKTDLHKWAVIACDQFTSQKSYWDKVDKLTANAYSAYHLTLPEIYLSNDNFSRINAINKAMKKYVDDGVFDTVNSGMILVTRITAYGHIRKGLVTSIDLEKYSWRLSDKAMIRATEKTVLERIYPRIEIRKDAILELPHVLMLIDDDSGEVFREAEKSAAKTVYDFKLNMDGGHINGREVVNPQAVVEKIYDLLNSDTLMRKYGDGEDKFLMAVGDGNHSLASAKEIWEQTKLALNEEEKLNHPARFALVEIENVYDEGILFEPIHRVVFNVNPREFCQKIQAEFESGGIVSKMIYAGGGAELALPEDAIGAVEKVSEFLENYLNTDKNAYIDYIHGEDGLTEITSAHPDSVGILLPKMNKSDLFKYVSRGKIMPKKTFSMGEATEKRYYLEARKIK